MQEGKVLEIHNKLQYMIDLWVLLMNSRFWCILRLKVTFFYKGVLVLHDPFVSTITTVKLWRVFAELIRTGRSLVVNMLITLEPHGIF